MITIFGTITFHRTLYQHKVTGEYYFYVDDVCGIDAYKNYDPLVRGILVQDSVLTNPSHTGKFSSLSSKVKCFIIIESFLIRHRNHEYLL